MRNDQYVLLFKLDALLRQLLELDKALKTQWNTHSDSYVHNITEENNINLLRDIDGLSNHLVSFLINLARKGEDPLPTEQLIDNAIKAHEAKKAKEHKEEKVHAATLSNGMEG